MKLHIKEQIIDIEAGEGRIRFDLIADEPTETPVDVVPTEVVPEVVPEAVA